MEYGIFSSYRNSVEHTLDLTKTKRNIAEGLTRIGYNEGCIKIAFYIKDFHGQNNHWKCRQKILKL